MSDYIPFEIQAHIMKRLPAKSLMRFRTVSKPYKSLIDSSDFIADYSFDQSHLLVSYYIRSSDEFKHVSILDDDTFPQEKFSLPNPLSKPVCAYLIEPKVLGTSHGVFWLYCIIKNPSEPYNSITKFVLWNPSIRKSVIVEALDHKVGQNVGICGFGVCPVSRDPKVVNISYNHIISGDTLICTPWHVTVYTLSSLVWRSIPTITQHHNPVHLMLNPVVLDGFIYWLAVDGYNINIRTRRIKARYYMLVSFDLTTENFMEVSLPDTLANGQVNKLVSKLKDCLVVLELLREAEKKSYGVWMMKPSVPNTFTKLYTIIPPDGIRGVFGFRKKFEPIFDMTTNEEDEHSLNVQDLQPAEHINDFYVQEFQSEDINYVGISGNGLSFSAFPYSETLLLHDH